MIIGCHVVFNDALSKTAELCQASGFPLTHLTEVISCLLFKSRSAFFRLRMNKANLATNDECVLAVMLHVAKIWIFDPVNKTKVKLRD